MRIRITHVRITYVRINYVRITLHVSIISKFYYMLRSVLIFYKVRGVTAGGVHFMKIEFF